jgi:hypothetical protein
LRVLGLFSLPEGGQPLNLRRERHALVKLLTGIAAEGRAVDVRVLQYGVTRERLRGVLEEDEGWELAGLLKLARELPHLGALIRGELAGVDRGVARRLALGVLNVAQGHPKLLELADGQAADPGRLSVLVEAGGRRGGRWAACGGVFTAGESRAAGEDYLGVLGAWTDTVADGLDAGVRVLFWFLCCLEEDDRIQPAVEANWARLWARLGRDGDPPGLDEGLAALAGRGLVAVRAGGEPTRESYGIHPGVADAGRDRAGKQFRDAVDTEVAAFWQAVAADALGREAEARTTGLTPRTSGGTARPRSPWNATPCATST